MDIRGGMLGEWNDQLQQIIRRNWILNPRGREGKCLRLDEFMQELVRVYKPQYNPVGFENLEDFQRRIIARCVIYLTATKEDFRRGLGIKRHAGNRVSRDGLPDVKALLDELLEDNVVKKVVGGGKDGVAEVKD